MSDLDEQRPPTPTGGPAVHDLVLADLLHRSGSESLAQVIRERRALGLRRYGTVLQAGNGRDAVRDAVDEVADLVCYLRQVVAERRAGVDRRAAIHAADLYWRALTLAAEVVALGEEDARR